MNLNLVSLRPREVSIIVMSIYLRRDIHCKFIWIGNMVANKQTLFNLSNTRNIGCRNDINSENNRVPDGI